jgi:3-phosphoshikimate 1-carboxyvinyltransferase
MSGAGGQGWVAARGGPLRGRLRVPGDKSISHRAVMLGALGEGVTRIRGFLEGEDTRATAAVFAQMGVRIQAPSDGERLVHGGRPARAARAGGPPGLRQCRHRHAPAGGRAGRAAVRQRAGRRRLAVQAPNAARDRAAGRDGRPDRQRPAACRPAHPRWRCACAGRDATPVASAQVKSAHAAGGLYAAGEPVVREPHPTRDYTERMLAAFGWPIEFRAGFRPAAGGHRLPRSTSTSGGFFLGGVLHRRGDPGPGSELRIERSA